MVRPTRLPHPGRAPKIVEIRHSRDLSQFNDVENRVRRDRCELSIKFYSLSAESGDPPYNISNSTRKRSECVFRVSVSI